MIRTERRQFLKMTSLGLAGISLPPVRTSDFTGLRRQLLLPDHLVYLNTGSLGPSPRFLVDSQQAIVRSLEADPVGQNWGPLGEQMEAVRGKVARFIGASTDEIVLTRNTTEGLNLVASALRLEPSDEIVTTNHEHGGGENGLKYIAQRDGASLRKVELPLPATSVDELVSLFDRALTSRTKVLLVSHVTTVTGLRMPLKEISELTRKRGVLLVVDGAQAPGMIDVDVEALGADVYATSGHKWLLGPKETGFLYIRKEHQKRLTSAFTFAGNDAYSASSGTRNVATIISLGKILDWHEKTEKPAIEAHAMSLRDYCQKRLEPIGGVRVLSSSEPALATGIVSVGLARAKNDDVYHAMRGRDIVIKRLPIENALRFSCHLFNSEEDVDRMIAELETLV